MRRPWLLSVVALLTILISIPAVAQEKKADKPATRSEDAAAREKRIKELREQVQKLQEQLAKEGGAAPGVGAPGVGPFPGGRPGGAIDPEVVRKIMEEQMQKMINDARGRAGQSGDPQAALEQMRALFERGGTGRIPGTPGGPAVGDPAQLMQNQLHHLLRMMETTITNPGEGAEIQDPIEMGQRMVIAGLEVQLRGIAQRITATKDAEAKKELTEEFNDMVARVAEARDKQRTKQIEQLEKRLKALKETKVESAEDLTRRLLDEAEKAAAAAGKVAEEDPADETIKK
jgi:DNA-binding protein H-NS